MSTLSGIASKGEKGKTKYQSIDINSLYRSSRVSFCLVTFGQDHEIGVTLVIDLS